MIRRPWRHKPFPDILSGNCKVLFRALRTSNIPAKAQHTNFLYNLAPTNRIHLFPRLTLIQKGCRKMYRFIYIRRLACPQFCLIGRFCRFCEHSVVCPADQLLWKRRQTTKGGATKPKNQRRQNWRQAETPGMYK